MQGNRVYAELDLVLKEGEYGINPRDGKWYARPPSCHMGCLENHSVTEHEDGSISVSPSILIEGETSWHGYLIKGIWDKC